jgi:hypothetical protein
MNPYQITNYTPEHRPAIRRILENMDWDDRYITAAEQNADMFSQHPNIFGIYVAVTETMTVGFVYVQYYSWHGLAQIHELAVEPFFSVKEFLRHSS